MLEWDIWYKQGNHIWCTFKEEPSDVNKFLYTAI